MVERRERITGWNYGRRKGVMCVKESEREIGSKINKEKKKWLHL